jgi:hypothetical protein
MEPRHAGAAIGARPADALLFLACAAAYAWMAGAMLNLDQIL